METLIRKLNFYPKRLLILTLTLFFCCFYSLNAQYLKAFLGVGVPNISDGIFEGTTEDIISGTGEWGNFLLLDFGSDDPTLTLNTFTLDFSTAADATIDIVYGEVIIPMGQVL
jgi:hypothetical protein